MLGDTVLVLPLHGALSWKDQSRVFEQPPPGKRKVILATNVAESSVTIDDVTYVVNTGKLKEKRFDPDSGVSTLQSHWASAANNKQRCGRAGRVRPGMCIHLFLAARRERLQAYQTPEIRRVPLDELCLIVKSLELGRAAPLLAEALEPPEASAVSSAITSLTAIGALDAGETLTPLGRSLAQLPLEPRTGKMLILAAALGVLDPALTVAACASTRGPFVWATNARDAADTARRIIGGADACSDQMVLANTYEQWLEARRAGCEQRWAAENFVNCSTMAVIAKTRTQLRITLEGVGIIEPHDDPPVGIRRLVLMRAVVTASLWPNCATVAGSEMTRFKDGSTGSRLVMHSEDNMGLHAHFGSTVASMDANNGQSEAHKVLSLAMYQSKLKTSDLFVENITLGPCSPGRLSGVRVFHSSWWFQRSMLDGGL